MINVRKQQYLDEGQHSRRNGRTVIDIVLGKAFTFDAAHFQQANLGCTYCDTKACYDWILPIILILVYFKAGLPYSTCIFFVQLLHDMKYPMTTVLGISTLVNYFGFITAVFGIRQGSTDRPPGWDLIRDIILKVYHWICKGCQMIDPSQKLKQQVPYTSKTIYAAIPTQYRNLGMTTSLTNLGSCQKKNYWSTWEK
eukprot:15365983-Ditylum_brightwellii.AAC.1